MLCLLHTSSSSLLLKSLAFGLFVVGSVPLFPGIHPKSKRIFQPLLPHPTAGDALFQVIVRGLHSTGGGGANGGPPILLLNQLSIPHRPARMVPSITHASSWLRWLPAEGRREPAHLPGQELQPPRGHLPGALPGCQPALGLLAPGIVCAS